MSTRPVTLRVIRSTFPDLTPLCCSPLYGAETDNAQASPYVQASKGIVYTGFMSKQGLFWLRRILIETAQHARYWSGLYLDLYRRLAHREGQKVVRVSLAHELFTTV